MHRTLYQIPQISRKVSLRHRSQRDVINIFFAQTLVGLFPLFTVVDRDCVCVCLGASACLGADQVRENLWEYTTTTINVLTSASRRAVPTLLAQRYKYEQRTSRLAALSGGRNCTVSENKWQVLNSGWILWALWAVTSTKTACSDTVRRASDTKDSASWRERGESTCCGSRREGIRTSQYNVSCDQSVNVLYRGQVGCTETYLHLGRNDFIQVIEHKHAGRMPAGPIHPFTESLTKGGHTFVHIFSAIDPGAVCRSVGTETGML